MQLTIPEALLPIDGRFGSGPTKIRPEALEYLAMRGDLLGTSHRQAPVRALVADIQAGLAELYDLPDGYQVVLGNGGSTLFWDLAVASLIEHRSAHGVFGEFTRKFANAAAAAPFLTSPAISEVAPGGVALPEPGDADVYCWAQNETSTGACAPVQRIGDGLNLIDATSAAGAMTADLSQTDVYYFAPQKNFSSDGGLWLAFASPAALERAEKIKASGRWLPAMLDFTIAAQNSAKNQTYNTPALASLLLLEDQINWLLAEGGLSAIEQRCRRASQFLYDWAIRSDFATPFVSKPEQRSPVVATIDFDEQIEAGWLAQTLRANGICDVEPYRGLGRNQLRIACYASIDFEDVVALSECIDYLIQHR